MISFNSNKKLEVAFKNGVLCNMGSEKKIVGGLMEEFYKENAELEEKISYISQKINEKPYIVIVIAMYIHPDKNLKEAVESLYKEIKLVDDMFQDVNEEDIVKNIRVSPEIEKMTTVFGKNLVAKTFYLKQAIEAAQKCDFLKKK